MNILRHLGMVLVLAFSIGCASAEKKEGAQPAAAKQVSTMWVMIADGSQSCGFKKGATLEESAELLKKADVKVLQSKKGTDGMMHVQMCGAATGKVNGYEISSSDFEKARKAGFKPAPEDFPKQ